MSLEVLKFWMTPRLEEIRTCLIFQIAHQILNYINKGKLQCPKLGEIQYVDGSIWKFSVLVACSFKNTHTGKQFRGHKSQQ